MHFSKKSLNRQVVHQFVSSTFFFLPEKNLFILARPAASVVGWLEEVLHSLDEGQYQGDGRSKQEVADTLGLDEVSLLTVVGRTAQKTALKIFRRKYPTPRARAAIASIVEMDEEELNNIYSRSFFY
jgi:hypothetical protein